MALPLDNRTIGNIIATTLDQTLPYITDDYFLTNAVVQKLLQRSLGKGERTIEYLSGGDEIRATIIYAGLPTQSYGRGFTFPTAQTEFLTQLQFDWRRIYAPINIDGLDKFKNAGSEVQLFNYVEEVGANAMRSLWDQMGYMLFGTAPDASQIAQVNATIPSTDWDGFYNAVDTSTGTYTTYGKITRGTTAGTPGFAINAVKTTYSPTKPLSTSLMQDMFGQLTYMPDKPDVICTTQKLWNQLKDRVEPQDRYAPGPLRDVGFDTILFNGAEVVVDAHIPPTYMYFFNTKYMRLVLGDGMDFVRRSKVEGFSDGFTIPTQDASVDQVVCYGNLVVTGPRYQGLIIGFTE